MGAEYLPKSSSTLFRPGSYSKLPLSASGTTFVFSDDYGFEHDAMLLPKYLELQSKRTAQLEKQAQLWTSLSSTFPSTQPFGRLAPELASVIRLGIPHEKRKELWTQFLCPTQATPIDVSSSSSSSSSSSTTSTTSSTTMTHRRRQSRNYRLSTDTPASNSLSEMLAIRDIEQDIERTFPNHPFFQTEEGRERLRRVLISFARRVPRIGYCQSLNFVCGMLLLVTDDEDSSLNLLVAIAEDLVPDYYTQTMLGYQVDQRVLEDLLAERLPMLHEHFQKHNIIISTISIRWFLCLLINTLSTETLLVVWDNLFYSGSVTVLFAVILALLKMSETQLLQAPSAADIVFILQHPSFGLVDSTRLLEIAEELFGSISDEQIESIRDAYQKEVEQEMAEVHKRREVLELQKMTRFTRKELQQLQEEFEQITKNGSGCISYEGFEEVFTRVIPHWRKGDSFLKRIFQVFDTSGSNCLEFKELMCGFSILCKGTLDEKLKLIFRVYDVKHRGYLELQELTMIFEHVYNKFYTDMAVDTDFVEKAFNTMDTDQDGRLTLDEFRQIAVIQPLVLECFARPNGNRRNLNSSNNNLETKASSTTRVSFHLRPTLTSSTHTLPPFNNPAALPPFTPSTSSSSTTLNLVSLSSSASPSFSTTGSSSRVASPRFRTKSPSPNSSGCLKCSSNGGSSSQSPSPSTSNSFVSSSSSFSSSSSSSSSSVSSTKSAKSVVPSSSSSSSSSSSYSSPSSSTSSSSSSPSSSSSSSSFSSHSSSITKYNNKSPLRRILESALVLWILLGLLSWFFSDASWLNFLSQTQQTQPSLG